MEKLTYTLIREKRKSITLSIDNEFNVIVKAPMYVSKKAIDEVVTNQEQWIQEAIAKKQQLIENNWLRKKKILYLGEYRNICMIYGINGENKVEYQNGKFYISVKDLEELTIRKQMYQFIQTKATLLLTELTDKYCVLLGCEYKKISVRNQKTRWGSCSNKGHLSYNIKIMCAPLDKIEYIVLHEVMHLKHFNHSMFFWQAIEEVMPDYKERKLYFKEYGQDLTI